MQYENNTTSGPGYASPTRISIHLTATVTRQNADYTGGNFGPSRGLAEAQCQRLNLPCRGPCRGLAVICQPPKEKFIPQKNNLQGLLRALCKISNSSASTSARPSVLRNYIQITGSILLMILQNKFILICYYALFETGIRSKTIHLLFLSCLICKLQIDVVASYFHIRKNRYIYIFI